MNIRSVVVVVVFKMNIFHVYCDGSVYESGKKAFDVMRCGSVIQVM